MKSLSLIITFLYCSLAVTAQKPLPSFVKKQQGKGYSFLVDGKPFLVLGAQLWNSSSWPYIMEKTWPQLRELQCNTLEAPVYWQNVEPEPGKYNFRELDSLIAGARRENIRLILLWFGSYKNGSSQYAPEWMLSRPDLYPRMKDAGGGELQLLSPVAQANLDADKKAFSAMMRHLKKTDVKEQTVILVQVENEAGSLGTDRDYSDVANAVFNSAVPAKLVQQLGKKSGTWKEVFGVDAPESFNAYHIARYINEVAEGGKQEYALPMYTNAWLREHRFQRPGDYPSGGPTSNMLHIWKATAPNMVLLAPDIYQNNLAAIDDLCTKYSGPDNPLFIPETGKGPDFARYHFHMLGNYDALGVAVYGIDPFSADPHDERRKEKLDDKFAGIAANYRLLRGALNEVMALQGTGRLKAVIEEHNRPDQLVNFDGYDILFTYGFPTWKKDRSPSGRALVAQLAENEFLLIGFDAKFQFRPTYGSGAQSAEIVAVEEGYYSEGKWVRKRFWNGDEVYHSTLLQEGVILKIKLRPAGKSFSGQMKANFEQ
ncbi:hypothetical protein GFS24_08690 [Chitinophaga sp. SYP-B3965]|uniref:DUF5597 domain-containing protein n=1 Tax=Chitinophaga sp. SYP-B3965 TaxID=2663120 RepID=UPI001299D5F4|nr:DUF5597 domain-containing protein [Chitinophaga sp. SYP-B3965]MRG45190.1 hypothetical protein [Chitinophaga sp. SYP-B3965]